MGSQAFVLTTPWLLDCNVAQFLSANAGNIAAISPGRDSSSQLPEQRGVSLSQLAWHCAATLPMLFGQL
jgi:hypothetical protein